MTPYRLYFNYHRSSGAGSHLIRLRDPWGFANHSSMLYAPANAPIEFLLECPLFEARNKIGVTGLRADGARAPGTRTLRQAVDGGDEVEVWQSLEVSPEQENAGYDFLTRQIGKEYDMPGLAGFLPFTFVRNAALKQQQRKYDAAWWCSELKLAASIARGQPLLQNLQPFQAAPEQLRTSTLQTFAWGYPQDEPHRA